MHQVWTAIGLAAVLALPGMTASAGGLFSTEFIAALGDPTATSGDDAETWGIWVKDPGPRGVLLSDFSALTKAGGVAPAGWTFDAKGWWLEEHGLIMEAPAFPVPAGEYVVTGGRQVTAKLTIDAPDAAGHLHWALSDGATLLDVTHLGCRSAIYTADAPQACSPEAAEQVRFPVTPGAAMPPVTGCKKQDYQVLIVLGVKPAVQG
jgi:hypothetical protein